MDSWLTKYMADRDDQGMIMFDQMAQSQTVYHTSEIVHHCYKPKDKGLIN